jgi:hypothetical protein
VVTQEPWKARLLAKLPTTPLKRATSRFSAGLEASSSPDAVVTPALDVAAGPALLGWLIGPPLTALRIR